MSRCFPFPPPGYVVVNGIRDEEAMIDSIKGEEKGKKEHKRKESKRDKKDKKRKEREGESEKHSHKRRRRRKEEDVQKSHVSRKLKESENSCFEKSSLTVERELVQSTSQNSCDSTLNSNEKEKKQPLDGRHNNNNDSTPNLPPKEKQPLDGKHGDSESIIRIRLPIPRPPKDHEVMMITNKDHQLCPSREIELDSVLLTREQPQHPCSTSAPVHVSKPHEEKRKEHTSKRKHKEKKLSSTAREALQFLNVVENWVPHTTESRVELTNSQDEECWWLTKTDTERCKQLNRNNETKQVMSTWPRASLLPEADVYALPYTVPF